MPYPSGPPSMKEIRKVARATISSLAAHGLRSCLFGSAACAIYGMENRKPNDVDIVVLTNRDPEDIKNILVAENNKFYLVPSANRMNTYQVLWFSLPAAPSKTRRCKVDILIPGLLSIPNIPIHRIVYVERFQDLPLVPLLPLILLKLRGWTDHLDDPRERMQQKSAVDEADIDEMLELAEKYGVHLQTEKWMPRWFITESKERIREYVEAWPDSEDYWSGVGLELDSYE